MLLYSFYSFYSVSSMESDTYRSLHLALGSLQSIELVEYVSLNGLLTGDDYRPGINSKATRFQDTLSKFSLLSL